jgi:hypothetical protein
MNIISLDPKASKKEHRREEMLEVLETMKKLIEDGEIDEFVACSNGEESGIQIHASCLDAVGGVGLFECGKQLLLDHQFRDED